MAINSTKIGKMSQDERDQRIRELHSKASAMWPKIENIIDELKCLGEHSLFTGSQQRAFEHTTMA